MSAALTGLKPLLKATIRQDRRNIAPWVVLLSVLSASSIWAWRWIFPDLADRRAFALAIGANPAMELIFGPGRNFLTNDGFNAWRAGSLGAFFAGLMGILIVIRNSRADEDSGQAELIASGVVTRQARLLVAVLIGWIAAVALGVVCFLLTWVSGGEARPTAVIAACFTCSALLFAGVAAVAAQLGSDARTANTLAIGTLGFFFVLRGYLDSSNAAEWTLWLTPLGWLEKTLPAVENRWWPMLPAIALAVVLVGLALVLQDRRDFGLGMIVPRPGPVESCRMSLGRLTWRLHRGALLTWLVAFCFLGLVFGNLAASSGDLIAENPALQQILVAGGKTTQELGFAFVATILQIGGIISAIVGAQVVMRMQAEQVNYRIEPLLAGAVRRPRYFATNVALALAAVAGCLALEGIVMGWVVSRSDAPFGFWDVLQQALCTIPAVWVLTSVGAAAVGAKPVARLAGWMVIVATFAITLLGPSFKLPEWALSISPLHHVPLVLAADPDWGNLGWLLLVACGFLAVGFAGFHRRDVV
ncbi:MULTISPECIES: ABC transporter permease [unclassified Luteococcus]|uniref:ABC transporter permease n=1 Tax=unclassified Luteococcus TaxID=2639923 RepID=UPI00313D21AA